MDHMSEYRRAQEQKKRILEDGTFGEDSVHTAAVREHVGGKPSLDGIALKDYQVEAVIAMNAVEAREPLPTGSGVQGSKVATNIAMLSEPPGCGNTTIVTAFLKQARPPHPDRSPYLRIMKERAKEVLWRNTVSYGGNVLQMNAPSFEEEEKPFCPANVVVAHHGVVGYWAEALSKQLTGSEIVPVIRNSDFTRFNHELMILPEHAEHMAKVIFVVSSSTYARFSHMLFRMRFGRLFYDHPTRLGITSKSSDLAACHVWLVESHPEVFFYKMAAAPDQSRPGIMKDTFDWHMGSLRDFSPLIIGHGWAEAARQLGLMQPNHIIHRCKDADGYMDHKWPRYMENNPTMACNSEAEKKLSILLRLGADVFSTEEAAEAANCAEAKRRVQSWRSSTCMVCWGEMVDAACVMQCCFQLMCMACTDTVMKSSATCPTCRGNLLGAESKMLTVTDKRGLEGSFPESLTFAPPALDNRRVGALSRILATCHENSRVVLYVHWPMSFMYRLGCDLVEFVQDHGLFCQKLGGNHYRFAKTMKWFAKEGDAQGKVVVLGSDTLGGGTDFSAATDVIFYSPTSTATYRDILTRAINARVPQKRDFRVHYMHKSGDPVPKFHMPLAARAARATDNDSDMEVE